MFIPAIPNGGVCHFDTTPMEDSDHYRCKDGRFDARMTRKLPMHLQGMPDTLYIQCENEGYIESGEAVDILDMEPPPEYVSIYVAINGSFSNAPHLSLDSSNVPMGSTGRVTMPVVWPVDADNFSIDLRSNPYGALSIAGTQPGNTGTVRAGLMCHFGFSSGALPPNTIIQYLGKYNYEHPVTIGVVAPSDISFGIVTLGQKKSVDLPIQVTTNGPVSYDLFLRADKPQIGGTGLIGSGSYRIDLPADLGGGSADLSGTTGIPLVAAGEGVSTINSNITLSVPDNADVGDHSANLTVTIRQK